MDIKTAIMVDVMLKGKLTSDAVVEVLKKGFESINLAAKAIHPGCDSTREESVGQFFERQKSRCGCKPGADKCQYCVLTHALKDFESCLAGMELLRRYHFERRGFWARIRQRIQVFRAEWAI